MKKLLYSFIFAFSFLTNLNVFNLKKIKFVESHYCGSVIFFPLIGLFYGGVYYFTSMLYFTLDFNLDLVSLFIVGESFLLNNFLHFDGYCDVCDAFLVNKDKSTRLSILKDTHIGSFALGSAILLILLKFILIRLFLLNNTNIFLIIIIPVFIKFAFVFLSCISKYPRKKGTGAFLIGNVKYSHLFMSFSVLLAVLFIFLYFTPDLNIVLNILLFFVIFILINIIIRFISNRKIGGVTGDVLGLMNELLFICLFSVPLIINYLGITF